MATNDRARSGRADGRRDGRNNNPEGRDQYSGVISKARENPLATAAVVGGAVAAGVFLWSRRDQISDLIGNLTYEISKWREGTAFGDDMAAKDTGSDKTSIGTSGSGSGSRTQAEISEEALTLKVTGEPA